MPQQRNSGQLQPPHKTVVTDPLTACLDANGTYICTAYHPRCYIIQKVTPSLSGAALNLNPNADVFESKQSEGSIDVPSSWDTTNAEFTSLDGYVYMNGDIGKLPSGAVYPATPDPLATTTSTSSEYSSLNGITDSLETYAQANTPPGGSPADPNPSGPDGGIPLEQLKQMLSSQLEYYFSRENLANDAYLLSQMDNDQYVPIWTVANFNQVKKLTKDIKLITEVLRESPNVQVDEEGQKVRPNHKRCIVILREIPDNTPLDEVKALFSGEGCPRLISCEFAHNNSWYVTFESDDDAQRAYRFLREEVREFQGKPIMARIKAKPMNRLPMPPVPALGAAMKNGYRTPPAALYDPTAYQGSQQRFLYTNGSSIPPTVNYGNQVHVYTFQQHQPFYPPSMLQPWGPASHAYFDIGSVFSVNGLAPQGSFSKPPGSRFIPRRNKRNQPGGDRGNLMDNGAGLVRQSNTPHSYHLGGTGNVSGAVGGTGSAVAKSVCSSSAVSKVPQQQQPPQQPAVGVTAECHHNHSKSHHPSVLQDNSDPVCTGPSQSTPGGPSQRSDSEDNSYRQSREASTNKEPMPPRHRRRRKEDEVIGPGRSSMMGSGKSTSGGSPQPLNRDGTGTDSSKGIQFDLEATAFPPLPGLEGGAGVSCKSTPPVETVQVDSSSSQWENRLSDVVKGTTKPKSTNTKEKDSGVLVCTPPRAASPASPVPKAASTPETKAQQPPAPPQQTSQVPLPSQAQSPAPSCDREVKDVGTSSDPGLHTVLQTPPPSPDKTVPVVKCMADKSTKTDDILLNGEIVGVSGSISSKPGESVTNKQQQQQKQAAANAVTSLSKPVPTTTNAATMTSAVVVTDVAPAPARLMVATTSSTGSATMASHTAPTSVPSQADVCSATDAAGGPTRLSYAQVAQHHKEKVERMLREKQSTEQEKEKERDRKKEGSTTRVVQQHGDVREPPQREFREGPVRYNVGRGGPRPVYDRERSDRGGLRRRDGPDRVPRFREYLRPRSPK
ncbi:la-related protein 4 [Zootermopsis nevadensis]|uniref:la-related protein 4 n=1 Tax=Zootermopsis nevadensis TaxID=136037 RepID=UPI000B8E8F64|nr:la-related protein 4 [Zootermopsis nevadensis]